MFQFPRLAFVPYVFRNKYLHVISAIQNAEPKRSLRHATIQRSELQISKVGFPIRKFTDQSLFAAPHDLSQRTTSFIASQRQGIHRILLRHLIALIIDAHRSARRSSHYLKRPLGPIYKRPVCFKHTRERSGQARSLTVMLDLRISIARHGPQTNRMYFLFTM